MGIFSYFLLLAAVFAVAAPATEIYSYRYAGKTVQARVGEVEGLKVNDICLRNHAGCRALKVFKGPSKWKQLKSSKAGNAPGAYCELLGGTQLLAKKAEEPAIQFCVFSDLSFIEARALYAKHARVKGGKR
ncbi:MAG: hypothetical protein AB7K68_02555 [Bacteriovoracia bacterium]